MTSGVRCEMIAASGPDTSPPCRERFRCPGPRGRSSPSPSPPRSVRSSRHSSGPSDPSLRGLAGSGPDDFHLTLAFLGDVGDPDLNAVCLAVAEAVREQPRFDLIVRGLGAFPDPARPRVLWAGVVGDLDALASLQKSAFDAATRAGYRPGADGDAFPPSHHPRPTQAGSRPIGRSQPDLQRIPEMGRRRIQRRHRDYLRLDHDTRRTRLRTPRPCPAGETGSRLTNSGQDARLVS